MEIRYINRISGEIEIERPPGEGFLKFLYGNLFGEKVVLPIAKQKFITEWYSRMMDSPGSIKRIQPFVDALNIDMSEAKKTISEFVSFNDFFYRTLKEGARKIEKGLVSPGDGKILAFENVADVNEFWVKGRRFTLKHFLKDNQLLEKYKNASMFILRLAPNDYHRYHFPYDGTPSKSKLIKGVYYSVSPIALNKKFSEVFTENKKEICSLRLDGNGEMLIIPVGATMVGSINSTYVPEKLIRRGDEMGYFAFGGSTIVLLFDSNRFKIDNDLLVNSQNKIETSVKMGERIGVEN